MWWRPTLSLFLVTGRRRTIIPLSPLASLTKLNNNIPPRSSSDQAVVTEGSSENDRFVEAGHVYFVATPIGNMADMSQRALTVLRHADYICAEDTRHTIHLLRHFELPQKELISHHEHNWSEVVPKIVDLAKQGKSIAVVSDAGTPGICDPGAQLAEACIAAKLTLHPIPGPSAVIAALSVCGFSSSEFRFLGFIPFRGSPKDAFIDKIRNSPEVVVFFEAPHRVLDTFSALVKAGQGDRHCLCAREITKLYEELHYSTVAECELEGLIFLTNRRNLSLGLAWLQHRDSDLSEKSIKGEFTIVVGPHSRGDGSGASADEKVSVIALLEQLRADGVSRSEAVKLVTEMTKGPKAKVYKTALEIDDW